MTYCNIEVHYTVVLRVGSKTKYWACREWVNSFPGHILHLLNLLSLLPLLPLHHYRRTDCIQGILLYLDVHPLLHLPWDLLPHGWRGDVTFSVGHSCWYPAHIVRIPSPLALIVRIPSPLAHIVRIPSPLAHIVRIPSPLALIVRIPSPLALIVRIPSPLAHIVRIPSPLALIVRIPSPLAHIVRIPSSLAHIVRKREVLKQQSQSSATLHSQSWHKLCVQTSLKWWMYTFRVQTLRI